MKFIIIFIAIIAFACNDAAEHNHNSREAASGPKTLEDSLYAGVMEGHDIGMAKMGKVKGTLKEVQKALDSLNKLPEAKLDKNYRQSLIALQEDLNYAEFGMNTWMEEFEMDSAKDNPELRVKYLQSEKDKVTKVRDNILNGLRRADSLLKK